MTHHIHLKKLLLFSLAFGLFTIVGTISHEYGHIAAARMCGYETVLHYGSMHRKQSALDKEIVAIYDQNKTAIENGTDFKEKTYYEDRIKKRNRHGLLIRMGGPLQTMLTGLIGLSLLFWRRKMIREAGLKFLDWLAVFLALFWLREVFNPVTAAAKVLLFPGRHGFGGDEFVISRVLGIPEWTFPILFGAIGLAICSFVVFRVIPINLHLTFILSGLVGGISGFYLWMNVLGPQLLP